MKENKIKLIFLEPRELKEELDHFKKECLVLAFALRRACELICESESFKEVNETMDKLIKEAREDVPDCQDCINSIYEKYG